MVLYGLKNCDTCRKALIALEKRGYEVRLHDLRRDGFAHGTADRFHDAFGEKLLNRRSTTWRKLSVDEQSGDPVALLRSHPALMKRPVIETRDKLHLGWGPEVQTDLLS